MLPSKQVLNNLGSLVLSEGIGVQWKMTVKLDEMGSGFGWNKEKKPTKSLSEADGLR